MPLVGGPSDKAGNSYERRWTVFALLDVLEGRAQTLRIEVPGEDGVGSEFRLMVDDVAEWHQAKRQRAAGPWTVNALMTEDVLQPWQTTLGRGERCVFVSSTGADELRELADRARSAQSWDEFEAVFLTAEAVRKGFERLQRAWPGLADEDVYAALRQVTVRSIGETELADWIRDRLLSLVTGSHPATAAAVLAQLADDSVHRERTAAEVWAHLAQHGIASRELASDAEVVRRVADTVDGYLARLRPLYIGGRELPRQEAVSAVDRLDDGAERVILAGAAGAGKSVVVAQAVMLARQRSWPVLVLSADRLPGSATTAQLGADLGFPDSPATVLAGVAAGGDALLVIDQLDAVSVTSGRNPQRLGLVADLLREARCYPRLRVLLACRQFDIDNDRELRAVANDDTAVVVAVGELDPEQIQRALADAELPVALPAPLLRLLAVPLHLSLYVDLALAGVGDVQSVRTLTQLYDRYWEAKRTACRLARGGTDEWLEVIQRLVQRMNDRQELTVPEPLLDDFDQQVKVMASEGVLTVAAQRVGFFHETFFDYCFARQFIAGGDTLRDLLTRTEQDLFHRAQVRQILAYERGADRTRYLADLAWLLPSPEVRLHVKALVVALLGAVSDPTAEEWGLLRPFAEDPRSPLYLRLWQAIRANPAWFPILDADGTWLRMLAGGGELADQAIWALTGSAAEHAARVCTLLTNAPPDVWSPRRRFFLRIADVHRARELVDLLLTAIDAGDYETLDSDLAHTLRQLAAARPPWATEVLGAFVRHAAAGAVNPFDPARSRRHQPYDVGPDIHAIATAAPGDHIDHLLPQLLDVMHANAHAESEGTELVGDSLWSYQIYRAHASLGDNLYDAMGAALAALAEASPAHATAVFTGLRDQPYESAAFLLARGYAGNPAAFADVAAERLATTPGARQLGYSNAPAWVTRELVAAISPKCSPARFDQLIEALLHYATDYERTYRGLRSRGWTELCLLNGIEPGLRPNRIQRRLAELRRKFGRDDVPPPEGVTVGVVPPPIPEERARRMRDHHWLNAMQRHSTDTSTERRGPFVGGAWELAQVLETLTKEDPQRFARLLLRIPQATAEAYVSAILRGLAGARLNPGLLRDVCRHAHRLGLSDANRWLVRLIETHAAGPLDDEVIATVSAIAVGDPDPAGPIPGEPRTSGSIDNAALNSTRGVAALAIRALLAEEPARLPLVEPALRRLVTDPHPEVRAAAVAALAPLLDTSPDLALALFHEAVDQAAGELLGSRYVVRFLQRAVRHRRYRNIAAQLETMLADPDEGARQAAASQLTLASYYDPDLDNDVDVLLAGDDETVRAAAIGVFAGNITYRPRRDRTIAVLSAAFGDPAKPVRDAAQRAFYDIQDEPLGDYAELLAAAAGSLAFADDAGVALHMLESSRQPLPATILGICEAFVAAHQQDIGDISTAAAGDVMYVVRLTLRLHAQHTDPDVRHRCLDLIDQLVVLRAYNIEADLDSIER